MAGIDADRWVLVVKEGLGQTSLLADNPALVWQASRVAPLLTQVQDALGQPSNEEAQSVAKKMVNLADKVHDDAHRHFYWLLEAYKYTGSETDRQAMAQVQRVLYPNKLRVTGAKFEQEAAAGEGFAARVARPEVQEGLAVLQKHLIRPDDAPDGAMEGATLIGDAIRRLNEIRVDRAGATDPKLFTSLGALRGAWSLLVQLVESSFGDDTPEHIAAQEAILGPWRRARDGQPAKTSDDDGTEGGNE